VSVVGFDDSPLIAFTDPPLTTVRQPVAAMSSVAVSALIETIHGRRPPTGEFMFQPELVVRGSTGAAAVPEPPPAPRAPRPSRTASAAEHTEG
jgi:alanine racemase